MTWTARVFRSPRSTRVELPSEANTWGESRAVEPRRAASWGALDNWTRLPAWEA
jgi:hypothetical protein